MTKQDALMSKMDVQIDEQESSLKQISQVVQQSQVAIQNLEVHVGQLASGTQSRAHEALPSNTKTNPKEHCKAITLRSNKQVDQHVGVQEKEKEASNVKSHRDDSFSTKDNEEEKEKEINKKDDLPKTSFDLPPPPEVKAYVPSLPYPQRLKKHKDEKSFTKFLEVFKKLHINIHFAEALSQMPTYIKFLKEIISNKCRLADFETVTLTEECSVIIQNKLPPKLKDLSSFTIPCTIGKFDFGKALCDLGASINLIPHFVFRKLGLGKVKATNVTLQLANRSVKYPHGIIKNVLVKVDKFYFLVDFIILEIEEGVEVPLILGWPFLATRGTLIDVQQGKLTLRVRGEGAVLNAFKATKFPSSFDTCFRVDNIDSMVTEIFRSKYPSEPLEACLVHGTTTKDSSCEITDYAFRLDSSLFHTYRRKFKELGEGKPKPRPSIEQPPTPELKQLPSHLRYAYLGDSSTLPVIIFTTLSKTEEEKLVRVLRQYKTALGWSISDI
ncbi:hypothetical protein ACOSQ2_021266 [Xanthoceras sorbifolium]